MDRVVLRNDQLSVGIALLGAEIHSVLDPQGFEFIWQADRAIWARHAPVLFPIVGALKDGQYQYQGKHYTLPQHGFARDRLFTLIEQTEHKVELQLIHDDSSLSSYPFEFDLRVIYSLQGDTLTQQFQVYNLTDGEMIFSVGGHPAFALSNEGAFLKDKVTHSDYDIQFDRPQTIDVLNLSSKGLMPDPAIQLENTQELSLTEDTFDNDALIILAHQIKVVTLSSRTFNHQVQVDVSEFPHLGIWSKPNAEFVCIEPWYGHADFSKHNGQLEDKAGMIKLSKQGSYQAQFSMRFIKG